MRVDVSASTKRPRRLRESLLGEPSFSDGRGEFFTHSPEVALYVC